MDLSAAAAWIVVPIQILCLDLLLGADNAIAIALVCRTLHPADRRKGLLFGAAGAILLRLALTLLASALLAAPYLRLVGAVALAAIAVGLARRDGAPAPEILGASAPARRSLAAAAAIIVVADAGMSIDNVIALAAIARGNFWLLAAGVLLSIPLLAFGSLVVAALTRRFPPLVALGCGLLGWIAGGMAVSDPAVAPWAEAQAPALALIAPALVALFVLGEAWFAAAGRAVASDAAAVEAARELTALLEGRGGAVAVRAVPARPRPPSRAAPRPPVARAAPAPATAAPRPRRDDRIMLIGLLILFLMAAAMIGFVMYMVQSSAVERFS
jgi:YjbE family integral membrane protein